MVKNVSFRGNRTICIVVGKLTCSDAPGLIISEQFEEMKLRPEVFEEVPGWVAKVPL